MGNWRKQGKVFQNTFYSFQARIVVKVGEVQKRLDELI